MQDAENRKMWYPSKRRLYQPPPLPNVRYVRMETCVNALKFGGIEKRLADSTAEISHLRARLREREAELENTYKQVGETLA